MRSAARQDECSGVPKLPLKAQVQASGVRPLPQVLAIAPFASFAEIAQTPSQLIDGGRPALKPFRQVESSPDLATTRAVLHH